MKWLQRSACGVWKSKEGATGAVGRSEQEIRLTISSLVHLPQGGPSLKDLSRRSLVGTVIMGKSLPVF